MKKSTSLFFVFCVFSFFSFGQTKTVIGIVPFKQSLTRYSYRNSGSGDKVVAIQDAVTDVFLKSKRFALVEREKMGQITSEKQLQRQEDFIDGQVIEQSKSLGAEYIVMGNVTKADDKTTRTNAPIIGVVTTRTAEVTFNIKVVDVTTGVIMASHTFTGKGKGQNGFENALNDIKPEISKFIKKNFKVVVSIADIEKKDDQGKAVSLLIAGGSSLGVKAGNELKVYEAKVLEVDGKKLVRKKTVGKAVVARVEDENFSVCNITEGNALITEKLAEKARLKCEIINE